MEKKRVEYLDYMRVMACFMVIITHACEFFYIGPDGMHIATETDRWVAGIIDSAMRPCVPLFVMISGFLLLPVTMPTGAFFRRRLTRIVIPFVIWSIIYATLPVLWADFDWGCSLGQLGHLLLNFNDNAGHLWFVYMLIGLYLIMPIISPWLERASRREERTMLILWAITLFFPHLRDIYGPLYGECFWNEFHLFYYLSGHAGFIVLAHYIHKWVDISFKHALLISIPLIIAGYVYTTVVWMDRSTWAPSLQVLEVSWRFCTPGVAAMSLGIFLLFRFVKAGRCYKLVRTISTDSYGIYLMHLLVLGAWFKVFAGTMHTLGVVLVTASATFITCAILSWLIRRLPGGKYIAG